MIGESPTPPTSRRLLMDLFFISFVILFFELSCIRWFGSTVIFLTFFTNLVLMACFLGTTVGCLAASRSRDYLRATIPLTLLAIGLALGTLWAYKHDPSLTVDVGGQQSPREIFFGTEERPKDPSRFVVPIECVAGLFFVLVALIFVGPGQAMGRLFNAIPNRVAAYTTNVLGSLAGILAFGAASYFRAPPLLWFGVATGLCLRFIRRRTWPQVLAEAALLVMLGTVDHVEDPVGETTWSPYYKVHYDPRRAWVDVNNISFQGMLQVDKAIPAYLLPHLLNRDAGNRPFADVLIIGAGSGNDVQAALLSGARHVDAIEIDPVIHEIGRANHPDRPYADPRVVTHLDDGRSFLRKTDRKYDLIIYALVDSLVLHSGYSSLRLESFLFTEEAFRDVKARLKPGGTFVMYNMYRQGWVVGRLERMAERVFGSRPVVISLPYQARIGPSGGRHDNVTFLLAGETGAFAVEAIRANLTAAKFFWAYDHPYVNARINGYRPTPPALSTTRPEKWQKIGPAEVDTNGIGPLPTDDWPFLYLREPAIPPLNLRGIAMVAALSLALLFLFAPVRTLRPNGRMFFLGAGFMLLETKGVVHMALLFGSTWVVNSVVFFAILVMILLSNLYVLAVRPRRLWPYYAALIASLLLNALVPMSDFLALPGPAKAIVSCAVVFVPVGFAGVIFATSFRDSRRPDVDFGSNIGGVILGGLSEYLSLAVGFNGLLYIAIGFYLLSAVLKPRSPAPG